MIASVFIGCKYKVFFLVYASFLENFYTFFLKAIKFGKKNIKIALPII